MRIPKWQDPYFPKIAKKSIPDLLDSFNFKANYYWIISRGFFGSWILVNAATGESHHVDDLEKAKHLCHRLNRKLGQCVN